MKNINYQYELVVWPGLTEEEIQCLSLSDAVKSETRDKERLAWLSAELKRWELKLCESKRGTK